MTHEEALAWCQQNGIISVNHDQRQRLWTIVMPESVSVHGPTLEEAVEQAKIALRRRAEQPFSKPRSDGVRPTAVPEREYVDCWIVMERPANGLPVVTCKQLLRVLYGSVELARTLAVGDRTDVAVYRCQITVMEEETR